jgi:hypothetical protein
VIDGHYWVFLFFCCTVSPKTVFGRKTEGGSSRYLGFLSTNEFPIQFSDCLIALDDIEFENDLPCSGTGKAWVVQYKSTDTTLVLKTVLDSHGLATVYPADRSLVTSLLSLRFYFLGRIQGFTVQPPPGIFWSSHSHLRPLSTNELAWS